MSEEQARGDAPRSAAYQVVARRYRPQNFSQLIGQDQVSRALSNAIATNRVGHAYLFTGARGTGKTSTARIFAKCLNCRRGPTAEPCDECEICEGIAAGSDVDVIEIDGASNNTVDEIRQLRSNAGIRPSRARFKIYIIDEVHMLSRSAFNALLKILEEPPAHVKFLFCTTDPEKLPITVLSRCQRFDFAPVAAAAIERQLAEIVRREGLTAEEEALRLLARRAAGSMRDSQSLLEQLLSYVDGRITVEHVHRMLGTAPTQRLGELLDCVVQRNAAGALAAVDAAVEAGVDAGQLAEQLTGLLRDLLVVGVGGPAELLLFAPEADHPRLREAAGRIGADTLLAMLQIADQAMVRMRQSVAPRLLLETTLVRLCRLEQLDSLSSLIHAVREGGPLPTPPGGGSRPTVQPTNRAIPPGQANESPPTTGGEGADSKKNAETNTSPAEAPELAGESAPSMPPTLPLTAASMRDVWSQALVQLEDMTSDMARHGIPHAIPGPNRLVVRFSTKYTFAKDQCERPSRRQRLEEALTRVVGAPVALTFELEAATQSARPEPTRPSVSSRQQLRACASHPMVQEALKLFGGEVVDVRLTRATAPPEGELEAGPTDEATEGPEGEGVE